MALTKNTVFQDLHVDNRGIMTANLMIEWLDAGNVEITRNVQKKYDVDDDVSATPTIFQNVATAVWTAGVRAARLTELNAILVIHGEAEEATLADAKAAYLALGLEI